MGEQQATDEAIKKGIDKAKDLCAYDSLAKAAYKAFFAIFIIELGFSVLTHMATIEGNVKE